MGLALLLLLQEITIYRADDRDLPEDGLRRPMLSTGGSAFAPLAAGAHPNAAEAAGAQQAVDPSAQPSEQPAVQPSEAAAA